MTNTILTCLFLAMIQVESSGNDLAIGDDGLSWGCLQIRPEYVADVNRISGADYTHEDAFDRTRAIEMARIYTSYYAAYWWLGREPRLEDYARIHNDGPRGYRAPTSVTYWQKVRKHLEAIIDGTI